MCISHKVGARCYLGRFDAAQVKFFPEQHVRMNWPGGTFFAPESLLDSKGRRIFWAWVTDPRKMTTQRATGSGFQSMPRVLSLAEDGTIRISPAEELQQLRRNHRRLKAASLGANHEVALEAARGDCLELAIEIDPKDATEVGLKVRCSPDGLEETAIYYQASTKKLVLDMSRSTLRKDVKYSAGPLDGYGSHHDPRSAVEAPFELRPGETLKLRVFLDKPLLEVFANERQCITQQIYPESKDALLVKAWAKGGPARLRGGDVWALAPARFINEKAKQAEH
jgi:sucrose-6-phosphate hydrolase SacC (GH32 family)